MVEPVAGLDLVLAEQTLLIALDDERGRDVSQWGSDAGLAAALLLDLARLELVEIDGTGRVAPLEGPDPRHELLRAARAAIAGSARPRDARDWVSRLPRELEPLRERTARGLVERGVLAEERRRILGVVPVTRYPAVDPGPERELRERLEAILLRDAEPTIEEALLIGLLEPLELIGSLVPRGERRAARRRAKAVAEQGIAGTAVRDSVLAVQTAVTAAVTAAGVAATVAAASSG